MNKGKKSTIFALTTLAVLHTGVASAFRCGNGLVQVGDPESEVNQKCGEPVEYSFVVIDPWGAVKKSVYDMGQGKFYQIVIFDGDTVVDIRSGSRH